MFDCGRGAFDPHIKNKPHQKWGLSSQSAASYHLVRVESEINLIDSQFQKRKKSWMRCDEWKTWKNEFWIMLMPISLLEYFTVNVRCWRALNCLNIQFQFAAETGDCASSVSVRYAVLFQGFCCIFKISTRVWMLWHYWCTAPIR